jgi:hypothetical protein
MRGKSGTNEGKIWNMKIKNTLLQVKRKSVVPGI